MVRFLDDINLNYEKVWFDNSLDAVVAFAISDGIGYLCWKVSGLCLVTEMP